MNHEIDSTEKRSCPCEHHNAPRTSIAVAVTTACAKGAVAVYWTVRTIEMIGNNWPFS